MKSMTGTQVQAIAQSWPLLFVTCYIPGTYGHSMMRRAWKEVELFLMHVHAHAHVHVHADVHVHVHLHV